MNEIAAENQRAGAPAAEWDLGSVGATGAFPDPGIEGFATDISVNRGEPIAFKVRSSANAYRIDIYRLGFYQGHGARKVATIRPSVPLPQSQPAPLFDPVMRLVDCGNWSVSATWQVPPDAVSGLYVAKLVREDAVPGANHIHFVVRRDNGDADLLFQTSDTTWQAYNAWGGYSLYWGGTLGRALAVSYNRPMNARTNEQGANFLFNAEYPTLRFLEANGYSVDYCAGVDIDRFGAGYLQQRRVFVSVGHDEYWSGVQRANVEVARDAGVHLCFLSGNAVYWQVRWGNSTDGAQTPYRTMICYKETLGHARLDPSGLWTGTWRDLRFESSATQRQPENALTGTWSKKVAGFDAVSIQVVRERAAHRFWRNTDIGTRAVPNLTVGTLGYEWDGDVDNGHRPPGLAHLSETVVDRLIFLQDQGSIFTAGTAAHHLTLYRHVGGALVFSAATVQWAWALDGHHDTQNRSSGPPDAAARQAMINLLADMGVQPASIQPGLLAAAPSTDVTPPSSTIVTPAAGASFSEGQPVTIEGVASDVNGSVAGVEVSVNGGVTWHPARGTSSWSYEWTPVGNERAVLLSRAVDDSGNLEVPTTSIEVQVGRCRGVPILLVVDSANANPFGGYLAEILRAEGLVAFEKIELAALIALAEPLVKLQEFAAVLLAEVTLSTAQQQLFRQFFEAGGRLAAMRPHPQLADVFGWRYVGERLEHPNHSLQYLALGAPGSASAEWCVPESLTYHGAADLYDLAGAVALGWLYHDLVTPTSYPAVVRYERGTGVAVAFAFDLARDVVLSRQGNPDWKGSEGDAASVASAAAVDALNLTNSQTRPMDMFARLDGRLWFAPARLAIPHADEKQRFLANALLDLVSHPTPRLWYLPDGRAAVIVNTGDGESYTPAQLDAVMATAADHGGTFTTYLRRDHLIPGTPQWILPVTVEAWRAAGHEVGPHMFTSGVPGNAADNLQTSEQFERAYGELTVLIADTHGEVPRSARNHTIDWVGWVDAAAIEARNGTRMDLNYYHYWEGAAKTVFPSLGLPNPGAETTGYFTGSGLPQRFCDERGRLLAIYQLLTEWPDEFFYQNGFTAAAVFTSVVRPMLDAAHAKFPSAFVANIHHGKYLDGTSEPWVHAMWNYAQSNGIPMITAKRLLDFVQARNGTTFEKCDWNGLTLTFDYVPGAGSEALTLMLPSNGLQSVMAGDAVLSFTTRRFKGRDFAFVNLPSAAARLTAKYS